MKIIYKKRFKDGHRNIYFCGIKILSYKKKSTNVNYIAMQQGVKLGKNVRFIVHPKPWDYPDFGDRPYFISIGDDTLISFGCTFVTHDSGTHVCEKYVKDCPKLFKLGRIHIGKNCFVGCKCIFLPGVTVGDNCVIGAGSVVTKSIPDGEVWAGNPAHFITTVEKYAEKLIANNKTAEAQELYDIAFNKKTMS